MKAVIFDMDGVIVDSEVHHESTFHAVMAELGYAESHGIEFSRYVGRSDFELWQDFISKNRPVQTLEELLSVKRARFMEILQRLQPIYSGVPELVAQLAPKFSLAVASGSERPIVDAVLALKNLRSFFPVVVTGGEVRNGKPAPDIFLHAAHQMNIEPERCWVIEDSKPGVAAARAAGMKVIAITNTHVVDDLRGAHHVVRTYEDVKRLLLGDLQSRPFSPTAPRK